MRLAKDRERFTRSKPGSAETNRQDRRLQQLVVVLGLLLTLTFALVEQSNARDGRYLTFENAADRIRYDLTSAVDARLQEFETAINFVEATHPGPIDEYQNFFSQQGQETMDDDPGTMLIEFVSVEAIDDLESRERALGNQNFAVTLLPSATERKLIITRAAREITVFDLPLLGLDVTGLESALSGDIGSDGFELYIAPVDDLTLSGSDGLEMAQGSAEIEDFAALLIGAVSDSSGELIGYSVYIQPIQTLLENVAAQNLDDLSVELYVEGIDLPVAVRRSPDAPRQDAASLSATSEVLTASTRWRIDIWADNDFGADTGLFDQIWVWIIGVPVTFAAYQALVRQQRSRRRLDIAKFELAHAKTVAQTDVLTGLLNRNGLVDAARELLADGPATVFFVDLDGFKAVNDSEGHERGDQVLRSVGTELRMIFRRGDLVSRLGGDEFVVVTGAPGIDHYIEALSERINRALSQIDERVACSIGVASRSAGEKADIKELIRVADAAMYDAKRSGGNQFSWARGQAGTV